ncbi:MAG: hypothetical protein RL646_1699 [Verrucomicrobiota bacterium]|jgi:hypothetical protein
MRPTRTTIILLLANLAAFALVWRATSEHRAPTAELVQLFPSDPEKLIVTDGAERLTLERRAGLWRVTDPFDWQANVWAVQRLIDELRFISPDAGFAASEAGPQGLAAYGLDRPRWTLQVIRENRDPEKRDKAPDRVEAKVGLQPSTRNLFLLTDGKEPRIIPITETMGAALSARPESYRVDKVFEVADFEARTVTVKGADGSPVSLISETRARPGKRNPGPEWRFEAPFEALADQEATSRAVADLSGLRATRFQQAAEDVTGLAQPVLRVALEGGSRRQVLLVGRTSAEAPGLSWARLEENASTFLIESRRLNVWRDAAKTLAASRPVDFDATLVTGFTITSGGRSITLHRLDAPGGDPRWEIPVAPGSTATRRREADVRVVMRFLEGLAGLRALRTGTDASLPATGVIPGAPLHAVELEFGGERMSVGFSSDPEGRAGAALVQAKGAPLGAVCDTAALAGGHLEVEPQAWRLRTVATLPQGARVTGLRIARKEDGAVIGEARLGPDGSWTGSGALDPSAARRVAAVMSDLRAAEFPNRDTGAGGWRFEIRVTDRAAGGAGAASETFRTYLCSGPVNARTLLLRDEADPDEFILESAQAETLTPLLATPARR